MNREGAGPGKLPLAAGRGLTEGFCREEGQRGHLLSIYLLVL